MCQSPKALSWWETLTFNYNLFLKILLPTEWFVCPGTNFIKWVATFNLFIWISRLCLNLQCPIKIIKYWITSTWAFFRGFKLENSFTVLGMIRKLSKQLKILAGKCCFILERKKVPKGQQNIKVTWLFCIHLSQYFEPLISGFRNRVKCLCLVI